MKLNILFVDFICRCNFLIVKHTLFNSIHISETFDEFIHFNNSGFFFFNEAQTKTAFKIYMGSILLKKKRII